MRNQILEILDQLRIKNNHHGLSEDDFKSAVKAMNLIIKEQ